MTSPAALFMPERRHHQRGRGIDARGDRLELEQLCGDERLDGASHQNSDCDADAGDLESL